MRSCLFLVVLITALGCSSSARNRSSGGGGGAGAAQGGGKGGQADGAQGGGEVGGGAGGDGEGAEGVEGGGGEGEGEGAEGEGEEGQVEGGAEGGEGAEGAEGGEGVGAAGEGGVDEGEGGEGVEGGGEGEGGPGEGGEGEGGEGGGERGAIQAQPGLLRFGDVEVGRSMTRSVTVTNVGQGDLTIEDLELESDRGDFEVSLSEANPVGELPAVLSPGDSFELVVTFEPGVAGLTVGELRVISDDPVVPQLVIDLQGTGESDEPIGPCIRADTQAINWGQVRVFTSAERRVTLVNCGDEEVRIQEVVVTAEGGEFTQLGPEDLPEVFEVGDAWPVQLLYAPRDVGQNRGRLDVETSAGNISVALSGRGVAQGEFLCQAEYRVGRGAWQGLDGGLLGAAVDETVQLRLVQPDGVAELQWSVMDAPDGSLARFEPDNDVPEVEFTPDLAGDYSISLDVVSVAGVEAACAGRIRVIPERDIIVQIVWDTPEDPDQQDEGFGAGADLDLHLRHPLGEFNCSPRDCYYANLAPDWGVAFDVSDDPSLDIDDTDGAGPEQISLSNPEDDAVYEIGVHYFNDHEFGSSHVTVRVFIRGRLEWQSEPMEMVRTDAWWVPARIHWPEARVEPMNLRPVAQPPQEPCE